MIEELGQKVFLTQDYEIYSYDKDQQIIHCQGQAIFSCKPIPIVLDLKKLKGFFT